MTFHHTKNAYSCALFHFDFFGASNKIVIIRFKNYIEPWSFYFLPKLSVGIMLLSKELSPISNF